MKHQRFISSANEAKEAAERVGDIDLLVNNAGVALLEPFLDTKIENWEKTLKCNVTQVMVISQVIAKKMIQRGNGGAIVNVSSQVTCLVRFHSLEASMIALQDHTSYSTSKGALDQLTRMMALELGPHNIRVNSVNPTVTLTAMGQVGWSDPQKADPMKQKIPVTTLFHSQAAGKVRGTSRSVECNCFPLERSSLDDPWRVTSSGWRFLGLLVSVECLKAFNNNSICNILHYRS